MNYSRKLHSLLADNNGFLKTSDAVAAGISRATLGVYVRENALERVAHGLYMSPETWLDAMYVLQVRYPQAVFSHETALYLLNLANREPLSLVLTLRTGTSSARLAKQSVKVYKIKEALFEKGIIEVKTPSGNVVRTYDAERTICDLIRSRRNIDIQVLQEAVQEYMRRQDKNIPKLMRYASFFSVEKIIRQYLMLWL